MTALVGQRFGRLVVTGQAPSRRESDRIRTCWMCVCDCGNTTTVTARSLKNGHTQSCGCLRLAAASAKKRPCPVGARYGQLIVLGEAEPSLFRRPDGRTEYQRRWLCRCDCGEEVVRHAHGLERGKLSSCGCSKRRRVVRHPTVVGARYGRYTVLGDDLTLGDRAWLCRCDCGTEKAVRIQELIQRRTVSCGCWSLDVRQGLNPAQEDGYKRTKFLKEELSPCPECGTKMRREYEVVYCPRRCDGVLEVKPRRRVAWAS